MEPVLMGNEILTIDADTRTIEVPGDFLLGVETDNDAERVEFQCPKIVGDNLDLSQYHIYIHYQNAKGEKGKYLCEDVEDGGENITFSWLLSQKAVLYKGQTKFLVCAKKTQEDTIVWNTTLASGNVLEGLDVDEEIVQQNDDVIEQILLKLEQIETSGTTDYNDLENKPQINGVELKGNKTSGDLKMYTQEEVDYMLADKMDKPYVPITITDNATINDALEGNFKIDKIKGNTYQNVETDIVPTPQRPVPINSRKVLANGEYVELRSLKESVNVWDYNNVLGSEGDAIILNSWATSIYNVEDNIIQLKSNTKYTCQSIIEMISSIDSSYTNYSYEKFLKLYRKPDNKYGLPTVNITMTGTVDVLQNGETRTNKRTFTTPEDLRGCEILMYTEKWVKEGSPSVSATVKFKNIMLVEGDSVPDSYVPPTVRDYKIVNHTTKTSKIVRNTFELLLTGAENWQLKNSFGDLSQYFFLSTQYVSDTSNDTKNTHFKVGDPYSLNEDCLGFFVRDVKIRYGKYDGNIEGLKRWLSENNVRVFGKLQTPTEESIPYLEDDVSEVGYSWQDTTSPSPDIESKIYEVDEINVRLAGKNLLDEKKLQNFDNYDKTLSTKGFTEYVLNLKPNTQYTISRRDTVGYQQGAYIKVNNILHSQSIGAKWLVATHSKGENRQNVTMTTNSDGLLVLLFNNNIEIIKSNLERIGYLQVEEGDVATSHDIYQETSIQHTLSKPLRATKNGSVRDVIDIVNMQTTYNITDFTVDGNTTITLDTNKEKTRVIRINTQPFLDHTNNLNMYCDKLLNNSGKDEEQFTVGTPLFIAINKNRVEANDINAFKKWFGENPLYFIGISKTPTTEPLEDELVEKLKTLKTFSPVTHVFVEGIAKPKLNAKYPKDVAAAQAQLEQKVLLMSETLKNTQANLLLQGGND